MIVGWFVDLFNAVAEAWLGYTLFQTVPDRRFHGKWAVWGEYGAFLALPAANIMLNRVMEIRFSNIQTISLVMIFFLAAIIFTKKNVLCTLAWPAIYFGTISLLELPGIVLSGWITGEPFIECIRKPVAVDYIYLALLWARLLFLERKWGAKARTYISQVIVAKNALLWIGFGVIQWWICTYFLRLGFQESTLDVLIYSISSIVLILVLVVVFAGYIIFRQAEIQRQQKQLEEKQRELRYKEIRSDYEQKSRELHDMKYRLAPIQVYLENGEDEKALEHVKGLLASVSESQNRIRRWTGNPVVDSLLGEKTELARRENIDFHIEGAFLCTFLPDADMCVLFGNLLDNAFEAAGKAPKERWVEVRMTQQGKILILSIKNSCGRPPVEKDGKFISTKGYTREHGWGLESVRAIVEGHGGELSLKYDAGCFEAAAIFRG